MATIVTLLCLVNGTSSAFPVRIDKTLLVGDLKDEIKMKKAPKFDSFAADELTLWNVDILYDEGAVKQLVLEEGNTVKKMSPVSEIGEYFEKAPIKKHIHVVIERPPGK